MSAWAVELALLRRWAKSAASRTLLVRGGVMLRALVGPDRRDAEDVDFVATYEYDWSRSLKDLQACLGVDLGDGVDFLPERTSQQLTWQESEFPGVKFSFIGKTNLGEEHLVSVDVGYGDPLSGPTQTIDVSNGAGPCHLVAPASEDLFAWKVHGLFEMSGNTWRAKDLADLWLLDHYVDLDSESLVGAIRAAFESRDAPIWRMDRLASGAFGGSTGSAKRWKTFRHRYPKRHCPTHIQEAVKVVSERIRPAWQALRGSGPTRWPHDITQSEVASTIADHPDFEARAWEGGGVVYTYRRYKKDTFPDPLTAATHVEHRRRSILREARGITFSTEGHLLARPMPKFFALADRSDIPPGSVALEKLDGSLVFPTPSGEQQWVWRTRRGRSTIADQAGQHASTSSSDYAGLVQHCLNLGLTPCFEWCSRSRRIVLDHPEDRLVLTMVRDNHTGDLWSPARSLALAQHFSVEHVQCFGTFDTLDALRNHLEHQEDCEGAVIRAPGQQLLKLKTPWYSLLHAAVEGTGQTRARWRLYLMGKHEELLELGAGRALDFKPLIADIEATIEKSIARIREVLPGNRPIDRRALAERIATWPPLLRGVTFKVADGRCPDRVLRESLLARCAKQKTFDAALAVLNMPFTESKMV